MVAPFASKQLQAELPPAFATVLHTPWSAGLPASDAPLHFSPGDEQEIED